MIRLPTIEDYEKRGNYAEGLDKCEQLLARNRNDLALLTTKLQLTLASGENAESVLEQIHSAQPRDIEKIASLEQIFFNAQRNIFPPVRTAGIPIAKMWDDAIKSSSSITQKFDFLRYRFSRAMIDGRLIDAQQSLVQLKAVRPRDRDIYMAHLALTQMISTGGNDLHSRLAIGLARKAVAERFDQDNRLDCRVPGQIFALQKSQGDLESIRNTPYAESKDVYDALHLGLIQRTENENYIASAANDAKKLRFKGDTATKPNDRLCSPLSQDASVHEVSSFAREATQLLVTYLENTRNRGTRTTIEHFSFPIAAQVRLFELDGAATHLIAAAFFAETCLSYYEDTHEAKLILTYLYMRTGLGTLAIRQFESLGIKEIQLDTVGHVLFGSLGLTHPLLTPLKPRDTYDPWKRTANALNMYIRQEDRLAELQADVLTHRQTGMLLEVQDLRDRLRTSLTRKIILLEHRRMSRLLRKTPSEVALKSSTGSSIVADWLYFTDNRDFNATFKNGYHSTERAVFGEELIDYRSTLILDLAVDTVWSLANGADALVQDIGNLIEQLEPQCSKPTTSVTPMASMSFFAATVISILLQLATSHDTETLGISKALTLLVTFLRDRISDKWLKDAQSSLLHVKPFYLYCDVLGCVLAVFTSFERRSFDQQSELMAQLRGQITQHQRKISEYVDAQSSRCSTCLTNELEISLDLVTPETLKGDSNRRLRTFCEEVCQSAKASWEGIKQLGLFKSGQPLSS